MSDFRREAETRSPSGDEVELILRRARRMRAEVMRNAMAGLWAMLQRTIRRDHTPRAPRHA